ncbi:MAG: MotA/TolQ/ExbB proton channel family protein [Candidatus Methylacidiphilales bacterium]|nr:MotA/TolQ/ExbB proton channel family protein [Candidatus Methylacidiphilales bacterium]
MFESIRAFIVTGGLWMIPIGLCSIVSFAIILERGWALRRSRIIKESLAEAIIEMRHGGRVTEIEELSADESTTLARLVRACLRHLPWSKYENSEALQTRARSEVAKLDRGLVILEIVVGIGPLLGLLGTIGGLITIFGTVGGQTGGLSTQGVQIAQGIAEALHTTVAGLVAAIPSLIAHSYYTRRIESYSVELEALCVDLLGKLYTESNEIDS